MIKYENIWWQSFFQLKLMFKFCVEECDMNGSFSFYSDHWAEGPAIWDGERIPNKATNATETAHRITGRSAGKDPDQARAIYLQSRGGQYIY